MQLYNWQVIGMLPDPDMVGESEYRAMYEMIRMALEDIPSDIDAYSYTKSILEQFRTTANELLVSLDRLRDSEEHSQF